MSWIEENTRAQKDHPFTLPSVGDTIISPSTGIDYFMADEIAEGGFAKVFLCKDRWDDLLAAKVLNPVGSVTEMEIRATDEFLAAHIARSPHILHVHDAFVYRGAYYIISEWCPATLHNAGMLTEPIFRSVAKAVLHGLHFMHSSGLAHCDVHAGNVFLFAKESVLKGNGTTAYDFKIGDFGQVRSLENMAVRPTWNLNCMPPECIDARYGPMDHRADLYQAGLLFLGLLSPSLLEFSFDEITGGRPRELAEALPHPCGAAIACMLRRNVVYRPSTALEAWQEIKRSLETQ